MIESLSAIFRGFTSAAGTVKVLVELLQGRAGDEQALLEEIKENLGLCWMVKELDTDPMMIIPELATLEYDRLIKKGFDFNSLKQRRIRSSKKLEESELAFLIGRDTKFLIKNIYARIKDLKRIYRIDRANPRIQWERRITNLHVKMMLLMRHLRTRR